MKDRSGFIKIHRQIQDWEWFKNPNTFVLFIHLILMANYADSRFEGRVIKRGQVATSLVALSSNTGLSIREVRTALDHLISTGEVTNVSTRQYRIITIVKYEDYQTATDRSTNKRQTIDNQTTNDRQTTDKQSTNDRQYQKNNKNNKNNKKNKNERKEEEREVKEKPLTRFTPPSVDLVREYCQERGNTIDPEDFVNFYEARGWELGHGTKMKDWKAAVRTWERRETKRPGKIVTENPFLRMLREREEAKEE